MVALIPFDTIAAAALPYVQEWLPGGRREGPEWVALNPRRGDKALGSFKVNLTTGAWADFASGDSGGDAVSLWAYLHHDGDQGEAAKELQSRYLGISPARPPAPAEKPKPEWRVVMPVPADAPPPPDQLRRKDEKTGDWVALQFVKRWTYQDAEGRALGNVCRFHWPGGQKEVVPQTWCTNGAKSEWRWLSFPKPRPLYGLHKLAKARAMAITNAVLVEGEKTADAAQLLFPDYPVVSWPGGTKAVKHVDVEPLRGFKVVAWPDADLKMDAHQQLLPPDKQPGLAAMLEFSERLKGIAEGMRIVDPVPGKPDGWDLADAHVEGWTGEQTMQWLAAHLLDPGAIARDESAAPGDAGPHGEGVEELGEHAHNAEPPGAPAATEDLDSAPFDCLGYNHGIFYYLAHGSHQVQELSAASHTLNNLLTLAPLSYWEDNYEGRQGVNVPAAANHLMRVCERKGVYDPGRVRGRGAWFDESRVVLHLGDHLVVNGGTMDLPSIRSAYVYEAAPLISAAVDDPMPTAEANQLVQITDLLNWEKPIYSKLLAGWCVVAPICGALPWRPHIWVTGGSGTGKTWVMEKIVTPCLGDLGLCVASSTTEPGLRQALGHDARPVVFDEAEGEDARAQDRIQNVMQLMRQASAETSAVILKGAAGGQSRSYRIRSCFAFASIGVGVQQFADKTRVTVLSLFRAQGQDSREKFRQLKDLQVTVLTEGYARRLQARAIQLAGVIRRNSEIFAAAGAEALGMQRMGDQLGALLAGAYALYSTKEITPDQAREWLKKQEWAEEAALADQRDELMCLATIVEHKERIQGNHAVHERTVGELISVAARVHLDPSVGADTAQDYLMRMGIKVAPMEKGSVVLGAVISNTHTALKRLLTNTPWAVNWARALLRLEGAQQCDGTQRFGSGPPTRAVAVPLHAFLDTDALL